MRPDVLTGDFGRLAKPSTHVPYFNVFAGFDRPQSAACDDGDDGILKNTGINSRPTASPASRSWTTLARIPGAEPLASTICSLSTGRSSPTSLAARGSVCAQGALPAADISGLIIRADTILPDGTDGYERRTLGDGA